MSEELNVWLAAVCSGEEDAFEQLSETYAPLIRSMSQKFLRSVSAEGNIGVGQQDLEQEARLALYRAAKTYESRKESVTFGLYAKICIRNALISLWRKAARAARAEKKQKAYPKEWRGDLLAEVLSHEPAEGLTARIRETLSPYENRIFEEYIRGRSVKSIAESVGRSEKSVSNALFRIRTKVKGLL